MTELENSLLAALRELESVAALRSSQPQDSVLPLLERLDRLASELPKDAPPDLRHYLQRKSYQKARLLLEGRADENLPGGCGT